MSDSDFLNSQFKDDLSKYSKLRSNDDIIIDTDVGMSELMLEMEFHNKRKNNTLLNEQIEECMEPEETYEDLFAGIPQSIRIPETIKSIFDRNVSKTMHDPISNKDFAENIVQTSKQIAFNMIKAKNSIPVFDFKTYEEREEAESLIENITDEQINEHELVVATKKIFPDINDESSSDDDIVVQRRDVLTMCPFGQVPIKRAAKSVKCQHYFDFDIVKSMFDEIPNRGNQRNQQKESKCHCGSIFSLSDVIEDPTYQKRIDAELKKLQKARRGRIQNN